MCCGNGQTIPVNNIVVSNNIISNVPKQLSADEIKRMHEIRAEKIRITPNISRKK